MNTGNESIAVVEDAKTDQMRKTKLVYLELTLSHTFAETWRQKGGVGNLTLQWESMEGLDWRLWSMDAVGQLMTFLCCWLVLTGNGQKSGKPGY